MLKPRIKDCCDVVPEGDGRFQIRTSEKTIVLEGATARLLFDQLLPLLDGEHTSEAIAERLGAVAGAATVRAVIDKLRQAGIVEESSPAPDFTDQELRFYRRQLTLFDQTLEEGTPFEAQMRLRAARLFVVGDGELAAACAAEAAHAGVGRIFGLNLEEDCGAGAANPLVRFAAAGRALDDADGLARAFAEETPTLLLLALDRAEPELLERVNRLSQESGTPVMHCRSHGTEGIVGPLGVPKQTACLVCYQLRVNSNMEFYDQYRSWREWTTRVPSDQRARHGALHAFTSTVAGLAMIELVKHVTTAYEPEVYNRYISINALTLEVMSHQVLKLPRCPACGAGRDSFNFSIWQEPR